MNKFIAHLLRAMFCCILCLSFFLSCDDTETDDEEDECEDPPLICYDEDEVISKLEFQVSTKLGDEGKVYVELYDQLLSNPDEQLTPITTYDIDSSPLTVIVEAGDYSAKAFYLVDGQQVVAIDGGHVSPSSENYCHGVECWEDGLLDLDLKLDVDQVKEYLAGEDERCFIATAAWGQNAAEVKILRQFRDRVLLQHSLGQHFVELYYALSPPIARQVSHHPLLKKAVQLGLYPIVLAILHPRHVSFFGLLALLALTLFTRRNKIRR